MKRCQNAMMGALARAQRGFSLATALFVITVMALLAVMIFQLVRNNAETTQEEILLVRAFYAAESGIQFELNKVFPPDGSGGGCPVAASDYNFGDEGLNACSAHVECTGLVVSGDTYYTVESTGSCGDVSRTIQVRAQ
jgi:MSHA biogenesis protein MshP